MRICLALEGVRRPNETDLTKQPCFYHSGFWRTSAYFMVGENAFDLASTVPAGERHPSHDAITIPTVVRHGTPSTPLWDIRSRAIG